MNKNPFILIPLSLLRGMIYEKEAINVMYDIGIFCTSRKIDIIESNALKDFVYCIYRSTEELPDKLVQEYDKMDEFPYDEDYNGFENENFAPELEIEYLNDYSKENPSFYDQVLEWYRVRQVFYMLNLKTNTVKYTLSTVEKYKMRYDLGKCSFVLLNGEVMSNLYKLKDTMTADDRAMWAMYMGISSIIGDKDFAQTTSEMIKCRMFGAINQKELELLLKDETLKRVYDKYTTKRQYNKLLNIIQDRNMVTEIGLNRRTYVSTKMKNVDELVDAISAKRIDSERKRVRDEEKANARKKYYSLFQDNKKLKIG